MKNPRVMMPLVSLASAFHFLMFAAEPGGANEPAQIFRAIRSGNQQVIAQFLQDKTAMETRDADGNTPLHHATFYLDAPAVDQFLKAGGNPNATNKVGISPLIWAVGDVEKVRLLLKAGANPNHVSESGHTALIVACHEFGTAEVVKELIAHGAKVEIKNGEGADAVLAAARTGDVEVLRLLLKHGADPNSTSRTPYSAAAVSALMHAAHFGHLECVKLLLELGADPHFASEAGNALHSATFTGRKEIAKVLLDRGVNVNALGKRLTSFRNDPGMTPLMYAAMSERNDPTLAQMLIDRGADVNARSASGETPLGIALQRGETKIVAALKAAGARVSETSVPVSARNSHWPREEIEKRGPDMLPKAVEAGLNALLRSGMKFTEETANRCFSCHQQLQPALAWGLAQQRGWFKNQQAAAEQIEATLRVANRRKDRATEEPLPVPSIAAWLLIGLHSAGHNPDRMTDVFLYSLARSQFEDGRWITKAARAPMDYSDVTSTALAIKALKVSAPPVWKSQIERRIARAADWLRRYEPDSTEERAMQILGLTWAGERTETLKIRTEALMKEQRADGGWAQLATLSSDAYATALALYTLHESGALRGSDPASVRGTRFLLQNQLSDGTWRVATRASPVQVAIDDIFPHGTDQWISSAATAWAVAAFVKASPGKP